MELVRAALFQTAIVFVFLVLGNGAALKGQRLSGEIQLQVKDSSGAPMQVSGKLLNLGSGTSRTFETDALGKHQILNVSFGRYQLELSRANFATQSMLLNVESGTPITRKVTMALSSVTDTVSVLATTPLAGVGLARTEIPAPVQTATGREIKESAAPSLSEFLNRKLDSVHVNEVQGNPFQPDVNYRGYTASPLLGTPQGISVYMDGVRLNQPFGDVVSWDLIPREAISEVSIIPGSNPIFGLNTLGGALSIETKDGQRNPGTELQLSGGSFGRKQAELQHGGSNGKGLSWFGASTLFFEDGWRRASPSNVRQFFGKLGWQQANSTFGLTLGYANNSLNGNGLQEQRLLARQYSSVYTIPDNTANRAPYLILNGRRSFGGHISLSANSYYRYIRTATLNGDINENSLDQSLYQPTAAEIRVLTAAGFSGIPTSGANASNTPFPFFRCIGQALLGDEPGEKCNGLLNRTRSTQHNYGTSIQATFLTGLHSMRNQLTAGVAYDGSIVNFAQSSQLGYLNPDLTVTGVNAYADGVTGGNIDGASLDTRADLHGIINTGSVYATDTLSGRKWNLTLSGRFNRTDIDNHDRIQPLSAPGSLTSANSFQRFNPAIGLTYNVAPLLNVYASYSEGSRAPTSIELGCADPSTPCKLPNALAGDPPLKQVVTRTFETGVRSGDEAPLDWRFGWFWSESYNDLLFVASTQTGFGYFKNFGQTRRQGAETHLNARLGKLSIGGGYTFLAATYQSSETINGSSNSTNEEALAHNPGVEGTIQILPGERIPLVPHHIAKASAVLQATKQLSLDLDFLATSSSYARGNENNQSRADGVYYLGPGTSPGYGVVNFGARYRLPKHVELFAQVNNLLNHEYYSAAQLGPTGFTAQGSFIARPFAPTAGVYPVVHATFYAPGAPRGIWGGARFRF